MGKKEESSQDDIKGDPKSISYNTQPGPVERRSCRDILFLLLFVSFWVGMFYIASVSLKYGDPNKIILPRDTTGNYCGVNNQLNANPLNITQYDLSSLPNLMYLNPISFSTSQSICIATCPSFTSITSFDNATTYCTYTTKPKNTIDFVNDVTLGVCAAYVIESVTLLNRCIPLNPLPSSILNQLSAQNMTVTTGSTNANDIFNNARTVGVQIFSDVMKTWKYIVGGIVVSMIVCFVWIFLMRFFATGLVWTFVFGANTVMLGLSVYLYFLWQQKLAFLNSIPTNIQLDVQVWEVKGILAAFIIVSIITGVILLISIAIRKKIRIAIEVVRIASKSVARMPVVVFVPVFQWIGLVVLLAYTIIVGLYLVTASSPVIIGAGLSSKTLQDPNMNAYLLIYHIFGFFWGWSFVFGVGQLTIAGGAATYYFTMDKNHIPKAPLFRSFYRAFRFHLGSIAFGSFLIAVVRIVRLLIWYIRKRASGTTNKVKAVRYILDCLACCMACLDRLVNWMNKNAYIHIAINGTSFCKAAHSAFQLIARNALRLLAVNFVAEYVLMLGKIAVAAAVFFATWAAMQSQQSVLQLNFTFVPGLIIAIESLIVSYVFLSVYQMVHLSLIFNLLFFSMIFNLLSLSMIFNPTNLYQTIDTIFLCFLEDSERNNGSSDKPYYMPQELLEIIDQKKAVNKTKEMEERHS